MWNIPVWLPIFAFVVGILGLVFKVGIVRKINAFVGTPLGVKADTIALVMIILGFALGGFTGLVAFGSGVLGGSTASVFDGDNIVSAQDYTGVISGKLHDGLVNATTTSDYLNDEEDFMNIYSVDANILDGEEFSWNITIDRTNVAYGGTVLVTCNIPDKEISGVTADNLAEKTNGKVDLDINNGGTFVDENTVEKLISFSAGTSSANIIVSFDQEETYHDGMTDMSSYVDTTCVVTANNGMSLDFVTRIYANS